MDIERRRTASGAGDFNFLIGSWFVRHDRLDGRLVGSQRWETFDGTCDASPLLGGAANVDDNVLELPAGTYRAATLRVYDEASATWRIWWVDGRTATLDAPVRGRFDAGVGTFYSDEVLEGRPIRVRFTWSEIEETSARWEQAFSPDGGRTWETNWIMRFERR